MNEPRIGGTAGVRTSVRSPFGDGKRTEARTPAGLRKRVRMRIGSPPPDGAIEVAVRQDDDTTEVSVRDHGPGIAEGDRDRVFERFVQLDQSSTRANGGTGLGLYLCRRNSWDPQATCPGGARVQAEVIDQLVSAQLLQALAPAALELSLRAIQDVQHEYEAKRPEFSWLR